MTNPKSTRRGLVVRIFAALLTVVALSMAVTGCPPREPDPPPVT